MAILSVFLISTFAEAAIKYGEAVISKGNMVVVRDGRSLLFTPSDNPVAVYENDVLRTMNDSAVTLHNPDKNRVLLGANGIMQVRKWEQKENKGFLRMLFGKFRARTSEVRKRSMNLRTATATIGIKGSLVEGATGPDFTQAANLSGEISMINNQGVEIDIPEGQIGFNVDGADQQIDMTPNENYDPDKSEDEQETANTEELDTEDNKEVAPDPVVEQAIEQNVEEVEDVEVEEPEVEPEAPDVEGIPELIEEAVEDSGTSNPKARVTIEIEN